jgi:hypothetical protein
MKGWKSACLVVAFLPLVGADCQSSLIGGGVFDSTTDHPSSVSSQVEHVVRRSSHN